MNELNNREQEQYAEPTTKKSSKQIVKRTLVVIGLALAVYVVYSVIYLFISPDRNIQQIYLVPENAAFIIQSSAPIEDWEKFSGSETWQCLKKAKSFEEVTKSVEKLDSVVKSNKVLLSLVGKRDMLISLHKTRATDWDFLLILDMQKASKMDLVKDQLETVLVMSGFTVTNRMHSGINILEMRDPDTRDIFYIAFVDNHLVGSYTSGLIESAIDSRNKPKIGLDQAFIETEKLVSGKGLVRVFINYERIPQFMSIYLGTRNEYIDMFSNSMNFAGLYLNMGKDKMEVKGYTLKKDSVDPYITALLNSGMQVIGKVNDRSVEHHHTRIDGRQGGQYRTEDAGIYDRGSHRTALVETENDVLQSLAFSAVAYPDFRNDGLVLGLVVLQVLYDGRLPVYLVVTGIAPSRRTVQSTGDGLLGRGRELPQQVIHDLAYNLTGHVLVLFGNGPAE